MPPYAITKVVDQAVWRAASTASIVAVQPTMPPWARTIVQGRLLELRGSSSPWRPPPAGIRSRGRSPRASSSGRRPRSSRRRSQMRDASRRSISSQPGGVERALARLGDHQLARAAAPAQGTKSLPGSPATRMRPIGPLSPMRSPASPRRRLAGGQSDRSGLMALLGVDDRQAAARKRVQQAPRPWGTMAASGARRCPAPRRSRPARGSPAACR